MFRLPLAMAKMVYVCPYILRFLVCGKEILLFLCVVVECICIRLGYGNYLLLFVRVNEQALRRVLTLPHSFFFSMLSSEELTVPNIGR